MRSTDNLKSVGVILHQLTSWPSRWLSMWTTTTQDTQFFSQIIFLFINNQDFSFLFGVNIYLYLFISIMWRLMCFAFCCFLIASMSLWCLHVPMLLLVTEQLIVRHRVRLPTASDVAMVLASIPVNDVTEWPNASIPPTNSTALFVRLFLFCLSKNSFVIFPPLEHALIYLSLSSTQPLNYVWLASVSIKSMKTS